MKSFLKKPGHARTLTFLTASLLLVSLTGCSDTDNASPDLEETTDATASEAPESSNTPETSNTSEYVPASEEGPAQNVPEPKFPADAADKSLEGARAALEYFWRGVDYARLTGDGSHAEKVSHADCDLCLDLTSGWSEVYKDGSWAVLHGDLEVEIDGVNVSEYEALDQEIADISFSMTEPAADFYEDGRLLEEESFESESTANWWAQLIYDGTAQSWKIEWVGLETHLDEDDT